MYLSELDDMGPQKFEWIISSIPFALLSLLGNVFFTFFPCAHPLQIPSCFVWIYRSPKIDFLAISSAL